MSDRKYRLTALADADIDSILAYTLQEFGTVQFDLYLRLIDKAAQMVGVDPNRPGSRSRDELGPGVRSFHLQIAAARLGAASHILYYIPSLMVDGASGALILRVLWEGMEPELRVAQGFDALE